MILNLNETLIACVCLYLIRNQLKYVLKQVFPGRLWQLIEKYPMSAVGIENLCRFSQCFCIFVAGVIDEQAMFVLNHRRLVMVGSAFQYDRAANLFIRIRRVVRFYRTPGLIGACCSDFGCETKQYDSDNDKLRHLASVCAILGDLFNIFFFLSDHIVAIYVMGLYGTYELEVLADYCANVTWLISSLFYLLRCALGFWILWRRKQKQEETESYKRFIWIDFLRNLCEAASAYSCLVPGVVSKKQYGVFGMVISFLSLKLMAQVLSSKAPSSLHAHQSVSPSA